MQQDHCHLAEISSRRELLSSRRALSSFRWERLSSRREQLSSRRELLSSRRELLSSRRELFLRFAQDDKGHLAEISSRRERLSSRREQLSSSREQFLRFAEDDKGHSALIPSRREQLSSRRELQRSGSLVIGLMFLLTTFTLPLSAQSYKAMTKLVDNNLEFAASQYKILMAHTPDSVMPRNYNPKDKKFVTSKTSWWTSGFYPGSLFYIYEYTRDTALLAEATRRLGILEKEKFHTKDHDLGFMIYNSFGNAYRITKKEAYKKVVLTASETLIKRYRPILHSMQSWDANATYRSPVIIDNMMNLEMLCWSADEIREPKFKVIAIAHTETAIKNHYRPDFSSYHVVDYNPQTGAILNKKSAQGYADESAWARGQSWGLYGFISMYRFTKEPRYLAQAKGIAKFILNHPNLPKDKIPYWDFNAPDIPNALRDVSAASILASALLELGKYTDGDERNGYVSIAVTILKNLSGKAYRSKKGENGGFILKHSVGAVSYNSEVDVSLTYADYYYLEALLRLNSWYLNYVYDVEGENPSREEIKKAKDKALDKKKKEIAKGEWVPLQEIVR